MKFKKKNICLHETLKLVFFYYFYFCSFTIIKWKNFYWLFFSSHGYMKKKKKDILRRGSKEVKFKKHGKNVITKAGNPTKNIETFYCICRDFFVRKWRGTIFYAYNWICQFLLVLKVDRSIKMWNMKSTLLHTRL